jgi:hypothetical protein
VIFGAILLGPSAHGQMALATIEDVVVGSSANPRALQGIAAVDLPGLGSTFVTSTGSCIPFIGTGNGLARFSSTWSLLNEADYTDEPCHFGDITIGSDGTIYAPSSEFDGLGFTSDNPFQINTFSVDTLAAGAAWNADALQATYGFEDLAGADYRHGDLYVVDYRSQSPDPTNIYIFDLDTNPPQMVDLFSIASRRVNGIEIYGNRLYVAADIDTISAALDVYDLDMIAAGVNAPIETYTFDISDGSSQVGQHSEGLTFNFTANGPELWVAAALGTIARRIELPNAPDYVTWTGAGSVVGEPFVMWSDSFFGWDGQPTGETDALIDLVGEAEITIDVAAACELLAFLADGSAPIQRLTIPETGSLATLGATVEGGETVLAGGIWASAQPIEFDQNATLRGRGVLEGDLLHSGLLRPEGGVDPLDPSPLLSMTSLALGYTATVRIDLVDPGQAPAIGASASVALDGAIEIESGLVLDACSRTTLIAAGQSLSGEFDSASLPSAGYGLVSRLVATPSALDLVVTSPGDLNADLRVDPSDLSQLLGAWGSAGATDLNGDGTTSAADLSLLLGQWGACGA